jgi:hypothetical protein
MFSGWLIKLKTLRLQKKGVFCVFFLISMKKNLFYCQNIKIDNSSHESPSKIQKKNDIDFEDETRNGRVSVRRKYLDTYYLKNFYNSLKLNKLTIPQLKELMKTKNIKASGTKKQDLIDAINSYIS